jgi:hypothetical protein
VSTAPAPSTCWIVGGRRIIDDRRVEGGVVQRRGAVFEQPARMTSTASDRMGRGR